MPSVKKFGDRILAADTAAGKVPALVTVPSTPPPIEADRWARLGRHPDAGLVNALNEAGNQAGLYRTREIFRAIGRLENGGPGILVPSSFGAGDRARYRFAFRTGPYQHALYAIVAMVPQDSGKDQNSYARLDIANGSGTVVASQAFVYGVNPQGAGVTSSGWLYVKQMFGYVDGLSADTEYYGTFYDVNYGRIQSACVFELASFTENNSGYLATNITNHSAVLDVHRQNLAELSNNLWRKAGATVFSWTVENGTSPVTRASATFANVLDTSVTTVSAASPGWTLDMTGKARLSQTSGVPVVMKVCASNGVASSAKGVVKLVNSSGTTVMSITDGWSTTASAPNWQSTTGVLPATTDKYDLMISNNGSGTLSAYAVNIYEYG